MPDALDFIIKPTQSKEEIERAYVLLAHTLSPDPLYHFKIGVTREWKVVDIAKELPSGNQAIGQHWATAPGGSA